MKKSVVMPSELCTKTLIEAASLIRSGEVSPVELTTAMLERIAAVDAVLHSYITVSSELALRQARQAEQGILRGDYRGPLHGIPLAVKDLICTKDVRTTCGSKIFAGWVPKQNATVIEKLSQAGAVLLGKLSLTEFAGIGYHPSITPPLNPWDANRWPGSSSSGSGVATAASLCFGSLGTDTGGSIRFPSAACGIVGLKPTYGRVSRKGVFPLAESLDHVGPMTRSVADSAAILSAIAGFDVDDPTTKHEPVPDYLQLLASSLEGVRIGIDEAHCSVGVDGEITAALMAAIEVFKSLGAGIREVRFSGIDDAVKAWGVIFTAECAASHEATYPLRADDYGPSFRAFLQDADKVRGIDYAKAHATRQKVSRMIDDLLQGVDLILCPTMGMTPFELNGLSFEEIISPERAHQLLKFTAPFNLSGNPAISLPCGFSGEGLPLSLQLIGRSGDEASILRAGYAYEQATQWHKRRPL
jgi:amidase